MYQALYRKYRPVDFDTVVGQDVIVKTLKNSIVNNKIGHAYMFFGPRGTGKTTLSKIFARSVNCLNPVDGLCCGKCDNCLVSFEKDCVDILELDAASNNKVDDVREIINNISLVPNKLKYKVYIVDEVHMLSSGAFNALLKTLEEPPEHVIFILATTDPQKVPETIISRCQCFSFKRIPENTIVERLKFITDQEKINIDDEVLHQIALLSNGGMRDSIVTLEQLSSFSNDKIDMTIFSDLVGVVDYKVLSELSNNIVKGNINDVVDCIDMFYNSGKNIVLVLNQFIDYLRNMVVDKINKKDYNDLSLYVDLVNELCSKQRDIKISDNSKIYFELIILKFINDKVLTNKVDDKKDDKVEVNVPDNITVVEKPKVVKTSNVVDKEISLSKNDINNVVVKEDKAVKKKICINEPIILNLDDIFNVRIDNILLSASKKEKEKFISLKEKFNDYLFDNDIGYISNLIVDSEVCMASDNGVVLSFKYDSSINQLKQCFKKLNDVFEKILNKKYDIVLVDSKYWDDYMEKCKKGYNKTINVVEEPIPIYEEVEKNDIMDRDLFENFGDIVEVE